MFRRASAPDHITMTPRKSSRWRRVAGKITVETLENPEQQEKTLIEDWRADLVRTGRIAGVLVAPPLPHDDGVWSVVPFSPDGCFRSPLMPSSCGGCWVSCRVNVWSGTAAGSCT